MSNIRRQIDSFAGFGLHLYSEQVALRCKTVPQTSVSRFVWFLIAGVYFLSLCHTEWGV